MALSDRDFLRELIDDSTTPYEVSDEFIDRVLAEEGNVYLAAAVCANRLSTKFAAQARSRSIGGLSVSYSGKSAEYAAMAKSFVAKGKERLALTGTPYAGGLDRSDRDARRDDTETLQTVTRLGMHDRDTGRDPELSD